MDDIPHFIRPMLFLNEFLSFRLSIKGSAFLVRIDGRAFAITAKHNVQGFSPDQYQICARLGSHNMLPCSTPLTNELHGEDFEDFVVIPISEEKIDYDDYDKNDACIIEDNAMNWDRVGPIYVAGFPSELNDYEPDDSITYNPLLLGGQLTRYQNENGMGKVTFTNTGGLKSLDGFSGGAVFDRPSHSVGIRMLGIVLRGSSDTSISRLVHFLDIRVIIAIIRHEAQHASGENSKREEPPSRKADWRDRDRFNPVEPIIGGLMAAVALFFACIYGTWLSPSTMPVDEAIRYTPLSFAIGFCVVYVLKLLGWWG